MSPTTQLRVYAALTLQTLISAGTYLAAKRAMDEIAPFTLVELRFVVAGTVFAAIVALTPGLRLPPPGVRARLLWLGFLAGPLNQGLFFYGLSHSRPAHAALLYALTPIGVYFVQLFRRAERASAVAFFGITIAFAGVLVLLLGRGLEDAAGPLYGDLFILGAVVAWVLYTAQGKPVVAEVGAVRSTSWSMVAGALLIFPIAPWVVDPGQLADASAVAWACIAFLGILTSVVAYLLWFYALGKTDASKVAVFSNLQPVATALAAWAVLGDPLTWEIAVGGTLVLAGVWIAQRR